MNAGMHEGDSSSEQAVREDLAAAFQIAAQFGWDDSIYTHFSVRVPGTRDQFLINPFGLQFAEVTASKLVKIDTDGNKVEPSEFDVNPAGFTIHSAIHNARHDAACIIHTHTVAGVAISSLEEGLQPCNQWGFQFYRRVAYHEFEGIALNLDERERIVANFGDDVPRSCSEKSRASYRGQNRARGICSDAQSRAGLPGPARDPSERTADQRCAPRYS